MGFEYRRLVVFERMKQYFAIAAPLIVRIRLRDRDLADHIERNGNSMGSNCAEGASEDRPRAKANFYRISKRETEEAAANWEKAAICGYVQKSEIEPHLSLLDEIARMFGGLIRRFDPKPRR